MKPLIFILLFIPIILLAQEPRVGYLSPALENGQTMLALGWKYNLGDNPEWANPNFDDSSWPSLSNPNLSDPNLFNKEIQIKG